MTVRGFINEALRILTDPNDDLKIPGAYERLMDALHALDNSRETTEKVTTMLSGGLGLPGQGTITVKNHKARVVLDD